MECQEIKEEQTLSIMFLVAALFLLLACAIQFEFTIRIVAGTLSIVFLGVAYGFYRNKKRIRFLEVKLYEIRSDYKSMMDAQIEGEDEEELTDKVIRFNVSSSTHDNAENFIALMKSEGAKRVTLFASPTEETEDCHRKDPGQVNLPAVAALVEYEIPGVAQTSIVVDGMFLTAVRGPRYGEVRWVMDEAEKLDKVTYAKERLPFTAGREPEAAYAEMVKLTDYHFSPESRPDYFVLLSGISEERINAM